MNSKSKIARKYRKFRNDPVKFFEDSKRWSFVAKNFMWFLKILPINKLYIECKDLRTENKKLRAENKKLVNQNIKLLFKTGDYKVAKTLVAPDLWNNRYNLESYITALKCGLKKDCDSVVAELLTDKPFTQKNAIISIKYYLITDNYSKARRVCDRMLINWPHNLDILIYVTDTLAMIGYKEDAENLLQKIFASEINNVPRIDHKINRILCSLGRFDEAYDLYSKKPEIFDITGARRLLFGQGKLADAMALFATEEVVENILSPYPEVNYSNELSNNKKILFFMYYGIGDEIRFSSIYKRVASDHPNSAITCDPRLYTLLTRSLPTVNFISCDRDYNNTKPEYLPNKINKIFDEDTYLLAKNEYEQTAYIACKFKDYIKSNDDLKFDKPHLVADINLRKKWREKLDSLGSGKKIGISWKSGKLSPDRNVHYTQIAKWKEILNLEGVHFILMQYDLNLGEIDSLPITTFPELDLNNDFENQAALVSELDLVISPCTALIELCGAIGTKGFYTSNSYDVDWRIGKDNKCMWFPNIEFIKSSPYGNKTSLLENLKTSVMAFIGNEN